MQNFPNANAHNTHTYLYAFSNAQPLMEDHSDRYIRRAQMQNFPKRAQHTNVYACFSITQPLMEDHSERDDGDRGGGGRRERGSDRRVQEKKAPTVDDYFQVCKLSVSVFVHTLGGWRTVM